jgi:hypothetical protein
MSIERTTLRSALALLLLSLAGCTPTLEDGQFSCSLDEACPAGFVCRASDMLCYRPGDGSITPDAGPVDAPPAIDVPAMPNDAPVGCGPNCIQLMVLNADPTMDGYISYSDTLGDPQQIRIPAYGTTSALIDVHDVMVGGVLTVNVPPTITIFHNLAIPNEGRYLLVLGPSSIGASVVMLESPPEPLHTDDYVYVRLIDMTVDETAGLLASGAGRTAPAAMMRNPFAHGTISGELPLLPGAGALQIELGTSAGTLIAALLADQIPDAEGTYYIVVSGYVSRHLDTAEGLRFIPGLPEATALRSSPLVRFINTIGTPVTVCDGASRVVTVPSGSLTLPSVPPESSAWALTVRRGADCVTGVMHDVSVAAASGRTLVSIAGDSTAWEPVSISEPMPTAGVQTIVIHNGLAMDADIAGASIPTLGTGSANVVSTPATIVANVGGTPVTFDWIPATNTSWVVVTSNAALTSFTAYQIDTPFDSPWTLTNEPGR